MSEVPVRDHGVWRRDRLSITWNWNVRPYGSISEVLLKARDLFAFRFRILSVCLTRFLHRSLTQAVSRIRQFCSINEWSELSEFNTGSEKDYLRTGRAVPYHWCREILKRRIGTASVFNTLKTRLLLPQRYSGHAISPPGAFVHPAAIPLVACPATKPQ